VDHFVTSGDLVTEVVVKGTNERLPADIVIIGAGVVPTTGFIKAGAKSIKVDEREKSIHTDQVLSPYLTGD